MGQFHRHGRCHQLMMDCLIQVLPRQVLPGRQNAAADQRLMQDRINFIECQPVFDLAPVALKNHPAEIYIVFNQLSAAPSVILPGKVQRRLIVGNRNQRLHSVFPAFVKYIIIKLQSLFIGFCIIPIWKDPAPRD